MTNQKRLWTDYPPQFAVLAKSVATATLPVLYGPKTKGEANVFRQGFYHFREALRSSLTSRDNSYPARLYEQIETLSVKVEPSPDDPSLYNVIFDIHPIVAEMDKLDPAAAQIRQLSRAQFIAAQRPPKISSSIFSENEMQERLNDIERQRTPK